MQNGSQLTISAAIKGSSAMYHHKGMQFPVTVLDARRAFGRTDVLIRPIGGDGEKWVNSEFLTSVTLPK